MSTGPLSQPAMRVFDRHLLIAGLIAVVFLVGRGVWLAGVSSPAYDDQYHLARGLLVLQNDLAPLSFNDPPLGGVISALPLYVMGVRVEFPGTDWQTPQLGELHEHYNPLYGKDYSPRVMMMAVAGWKCFLFGLMAVVVFGWARWNWGLAAGWVSMGVLLLDPTFAGHAHLASLDVAGAGGVLLVCLALCGFLHKPSWTRTALLSLACAFAMTTKHTALIAPIFSLVVAGGWFFLAGDHHPLRVLGMRKLASRAGGAVLMGCVFVWAMTLFDVSRPQQWGRSVPMEYENPFSVGRVIINPNMSRTLPAGTYLGSITEAYNHKLDGHPSYLLGEIRDRGGFWHYQLVCAAMKVPYPTMLLAVLAMMTYRKHKPTTTDVVLISAAGVWGVYVSLSEISIGFRHGLPSYLALMVLVGRAVLIRDVLSKPVRLAKSHLGDWMLRRGRLAGGVAVSGLMAGLVAENVRVHPYYAGYINGPYKNAHVLISDSNIDWGQNLPSVKRWIEANVPKETPVKVLYWGDPWGPHVAHWVGASAVIRLGERLPKEGYVAASAVCEVFYPEFYGMLRRHEPVAVIAGGAYRIYDMGAIWQKEQKTTPADKLTPWQDGY